jgi:ZIP family zinc transporter
MRAARSIVRKRAHVLLIALAAATCASTLLGGLFALALRDRLHLILGFSAGAVFGVAFFDLLPEAIGSRTIAAAPQSVLVWSAVGFMAYLLLDRLVTPHAEPAARGGLAAAVLCLHSLLDGVAIGLAFQVARAVGLVVAIGVLTHDFSDGINTMNVVLRGGTKRSKALRWLAFDALAPALGIGLTQLITLPTRDLGPVLALFGGMFVYLGASDLIPESYHAHPKALTTVMTLAGAAVIYFAVLIA